MIIGLQPALSSPTTVQARFGNSEKKVEEAKSEPPASELLVDTPGMQRLQEENYYLEKEKKEYAELTKYDQYTQRALIASSAVSALLGNYGYSVILAAYPLGKSFYTMLKRLGEWKVD